MEGKQTRGRQKIEMKRIENEDDRHITFSKRKSGIYKKASELTTLCGAEVGVVIFSPSGKPFSFAHPSIDSISNRFLNRIPPENNDTTQALVEAHKKMRLDAIKEQHNELLNDFESEKERGKRLEIMDKERRKEKGWWDVPIESLSLEELQQMYSSFQDIHDNLANHLRMRSTFGESSSSSMFHAGTSTQQPDQFP